MRTVLLVFSLFTSTYNNAGCIVVAESMYQIGEEILQMLPSKILLGEKTKYNGTENRMPNMI